MADIPDRFEKQSLHKLEAQKAIERERLKQTLEKAAEERPSERYINAARAGAVEHPDHLIKAQGRAGERVALQEIKDQQGRVTDLNDGGAANFPIYDVAGPEGVASVKVRGLEDGSELSEATLKQYTRDLEEAIGQGGGPVEPALGDAGDDFSPTKFNNAARHLHERARSGDALPSEIAQSPEAAANYLRESAELKIPSDHAQQVQQFLRKQLLSSDAVTQEVQALRLGLDIRSPQCRGGVEKMTNRVKELPITSEQLRIVLND